MKTIHLPKRLILVMMTFTLLLFTACGSSSSDTNHLPGKNKQDSQKGATNSQDMTEYSKEVFAMDTYMTITAYGEKAQEAVEEAESEIQRLDALWSIGIADSEISRLNETEGSLVLSPETAELVEKSLELYQETQGKFDITIYPLMVEWGFTNKEFKVPAQEVLQHLLENVDAGSLDYDKDTRKLTLAKDVKIDLGGIAKGYTSSHIMDIFEKYDIVSGLVSLGGNVQTYHTKTDGSLWKIAVENPDNTVGQLSKVDYVGILQVADQAVITSGGYERYFEEDGIRYHHILDPFTGYPADSGMISVTIVSDDGTLADGLSTSLFIMGKDTAIDFWREHKTEFDAILIDDQGKITVTKGLEDSFSSDLKYEIVEQIIENDDKI